MSNKCEICANYLSGIEKCKFCSFEYEQRYTSDDWDIFNLDEDEWEHIQIRNRLWAKGIECIGADIWSYNDMAIVYGYGDDSSKLARALNLHKKSVYVDNYHDITILNLFEEKIIRADEEHICGECEYFEHGKLNICNRNHTVRGYNQSACDYYVKD